MDDTHSVMWAGSSLMPLVLSSRPRKVGTKSCQGAVTSTVSVFGWDFISQWYSKLRTLSLRPSVRSAGLTFLRVRTKELGESFFSLSGDFGLRFESRRTSAVAL